MGPKALIALSVRVWTATMTTRATTSRPATRPHGEAPRHRTVVQRHPVDLVRALLGLSIFGIGFLIAQRGQLSVFERDVFRIVNDLPEIVFPIVWAVMQLGNVIAVPVLAGVAALTGRFRMARDMLVSGLLAYAAADMVKSVVGRERPAGLIDANLLDGNVSGIGFISGHAAVAAALATAAVPYLTRRGRRFAWTLAWTVALARVYVGAHLPLDIVGGVAVGWAIGSLVHFVFGVPRREPEPAGVARMLQRFGLPVRDLRPAGAEARSSHPFEAVERGRPTALREGARPGPLRAGLAVPALPARRRARHQGRRRGGPARTAGRARGGGGDDRPGTWGAGARRSCSPAGTTGVPSSCRSTSSGGTLDELPPEQLTPALLAPGVGAGRPPARRPRGPPRPGRVERAGRRGRPHRGWWTSATP